MESEAVVAELSAGEQTLHITLSGLKAQTVYYFIITATNTVGSSRSEVESFETSKDTTGTTICVSLIPNTATMGDVGMHV